MIEVNPSKIEQEKLPDGRVRLKVSLDVTYDPKKNTWVSPVILSAWRNLVHALSPQEKPRG